ncbi:hypothetical protein D8674_008375 [Pyrus ussuriensis x Pyrus communis]|uniref:Senescence regulator S40 n=1 Tax=Pyrus ussuriensis x Pyrus communis TaxID=2448454 RepID=A0A5N5HSL5_9ROSA|nr:hypothetical protein D8674_008375 [Pyrus ussuriensis x Pyrus communis]
MASRNSSFYGKPSSIFPATSMDDSPIGSDGLFDFDEADIWNSSSSPVAESKKSSVPSRREPKKTGRKVMVMSMGVAEMVGAAKVVTSSSLPVNIPDCSKILQEGYKEHRKLESGEGGGGDFYGADDDNDGGYGSVPPHEYLARMRGASFSVHEGIGRTLKGRDLRRVRNAIWEKVGFED